MRYLDRDGEPQETWSPRPDRRHLPARGRPPRRGPVPRPGHRPADVFDLGAVRALPRGATRSCERVAPCAWTGSVTALLVRARLARRRASRAGRADRASRASGSSAVAAGVAAPPRAPTCSAASTLPGACQRPLARLPARAARADRRRRRRLVLDLARADVRAGRGARPRRDAARSPGRPSPRWRWPGSRSSASSTTCTTPRRLPTRTPTRWAAVIRRRRGRHPADAARRLLPARRDRPRSGAAALLRRRRRAWAERVDRRSQPGPGRADRRRDPQRPRGRPRVGARSSPRWRDERGWPLHAHVSEQPAENEACLELYGADADRRCSTGRAPCRSASPPSTPPTSPTTTRAAGEARACCCLCPTTERDLADGIGPARAARRRLLARGRQRLARGHRAVRGGPRDRARRAPGAAACAGSHGAEAARGARPRRGYASLGWPEGGAIRAGALADLVTLSARLASASPGTRADGCARRSSSSPAAAADVTRRDRRWAGSSSATAATSTLDVAAELSSRCARWRREHAASIDNIGLLVTYEPALGEGPLGIVRDAALVVRGRARGGDRARRAPPPTSGSTPAAAA